MLTKSEINAKLKNYKFLHLMFNDKFNKPFVDFLNRNFNIKEHLILCQNWFKEFPFPEGENVIEFDNYKDLIIPENIDKIICHSLCDMNLVKYLYNHQDMLKTKAYWMIWGGDLYDAPRNDVDDFVRQNFKGYISDTDGDCAIAKDKYNSNPQVFEAGYTFPITKEMLNNTTKTPHNYIKIQINNSCDKTTLEMLDILSKFKNENIKITTILSYGQLEYKEEIIKKGKNIFGDKFEFLDKLIPPEKYANYVAKNDILILNQNRQQGIGNSFATLALGGKLFIKSEITTYNHFNSRDIQVFDTNKINNLSFKEFINYDENIKQQNKQKSLIFFEDKYLKDLWEEVFNG